MTPLFLVTEQSRLRRFYRTQNNSGRTCCFCRSLRRRQPRYWRCTNNGGSTSIRAHQISISEVLHQSAFSASATIDNPSQGQTKYVYARCAWDRQGIIQYESEPVMNRLSMLPENQLTDILMSLDRQYPRPKN